MANVHHAGRTNTSSPFSTVSRVRVLQCARQVMSEWSDLVMAFGQSDEFSFLLPASSPLYGRRSAKLSTSFVSLFSSRYACDTMWVMCGH